ncbi:hypothetical protein ACRTDU_03845 [Sunxiuqinia elliptica]
MKRILIILLLFISSISVGQVPGIGNMILLRNNIPNGPWVENQEIISGLYNAYYNSISVFELDGSYYAIANEYNAVSYGYIWNGSGWTNNTSIVSGLTSYGRSRTYVFQVGTSLYALTFTNNANYGFKWNGTSWVSDNSIEINGGSFSSDGTPTVFKSGGYYRMLVGDGLGNITGYFRNGSTWYESDIFEAGLPRLYSDARPTVFSIDTDLYLIVSYVDAAGTTWSVAGFKWNGTSWVSDSAIIAGLALTSVDDPINGSAFIIDGSLYFIAGQYHMWNGFKF